MPSSPILQAWRNTASAGAVVISAATHGVESGRAGYAPPRPFDPTVGMMPPARTFTNTSPALLARTTLRPRLNGARSPTSRGGPPAQPPLDGNAADDLAVFEHVVVVVAPTRGVAALEGQRRHG